MSEFADLKGKTLNEVNVSRDDDNKIVFTTTVGDKYKLYHEQDCCESVYIEDINGDLSDLIGSEILLAEESSSETMPEGASSDLDDSNTWTFYKIATIKGHIVIRWIGSSNGYYSESVDFMKTGASQ